MRRRTVVPAPKTLAVLDSLLKSFADDWVPAAACATFAAASEGDGVIVGRCAECANYRIYEWTTKKYSAEQLGYRRAGTRAGDSMSTRKLRKSCPSSEDASMDVVRSTDLAQCIFT